MRGVFVTGTGTGTGKTIVAASIAAALRARNEPVMAFKPIITGTDEPPGPFGRDHELLAKAVASGRPSRVCRHLYRASVSPHFAAELEGRRVEPAELQPRVHAHEILICEGVGGFLVPLTKDYLVRDLAVELGLPVVIATHPDLGTINHALLTVDAVRGAGLAAAGIVMTPWPAQPSRMQESNREAIERLSGVTVSTLREITPLELADAGAELPLDDFLAAGPTA